MKACIISISLPTCKLISYHVGVYALMMFQDRCTAAPRAEGSSTQLLHQRRGCSLAGQQCGGCDHTRDGCGYHAGNSCTACVNFPLTVCKYEKLISIFAKVSLKYNN